MPKILLTGGAGYIASHTAICLLEAGFEVLALDNFCNSQAEAVRRVERISGKSLPLIEGDIRDATLLRRVFSQNDISAVVHRASKRSENPPYNRCVITITTSLEL
jgi:UDP-glucose 4-epimerase